ncbi:MAG: ferrochelatase [Betaproteobacteria bacterium CG2_30_59_46]|nr:MAG: ferrochelatase [Betaproteobacteria bacterium CG2_30_59_46]PIQ13327.1 MAG: ferrochelatase [Hydrogenophilales bacterium CG18_big_fil_WC_8_21_14_2_50_58_12]PIX99325.1 MAG: ferrochelatase [Hydrogenophilales bacterium CG_4_10_14_3_um_filter_58_23]PJB07140.1 MAG: ferrochelatase [Hydrogenophilales bacterium CG_4_9_14_3_um_filter_59_35]
MEPTYRHGTAAKTGILLINLGTPDAPTAAAVKPYLREFLSDPRVVEIPRALWWLILNGVILNTRPKKSAEKYAQIWTEEGSPLLVHTQRQARMLRGYLGESLKAPPALPLSPTLSHGGESPLPHAGEGAMVRSQGSSPWLYSAEAEQRTRKDVVLIEYAMRYGNPSVASALEKLKQQNCGRILILPLYPQYAASSTASAMDAVFGALRKMRNLPAIRTVRSFHDHPGYIAALAQSVRDDWMQNGRPDVLVMSFHGVPRYTLDKGDPYHCECQKTGRLLAEALELKPDQYRISFQSRFGRAEWLKPYTAATLEELGKQGVGRVDAICPGFVGDCLETLEEIAMEGKASFLGAGGGAFHYIPCLNERDDWIRALSHIVSENLQGWIAPEENEACAASRDRALAMGAKD